MTEPMTSYSVAHATTIELQPPGLIARTILYISQSHDLTVAALAPPMMHCKWQSTLPPTFGKGRSGKGKPMHARTSLLLPSLATMQFIVHVGFAPCMAAVILAPDKMMFLLLPYHLLHMVSSAYHHPPFVS